MIVVALMFVVGGVAQELPMFSWETPPVFVHMCNRSGEFSQEAVEFLARFPMVTFEKGQGEAESSCCAEDKILAAAKQIKAINSSVHTLFYYNSVLNWEMYRMAEVFEQHSSWWLRDLNGEVIRLQGDHSFPQPKNGMLVFDFAQEVVRNFWASACLNMTKTGFINGCFADRANEDSFPKHNISKEYAAGHLKVLQDLQANMNTGVLIDNNANLPGTKAQMIEAFTGDQDSLETLMAAVAAGHLVQAHAGYKGPEHKSNCTDITDSLAAFLIGAGSHSYYGCSLGWYIDTWYHWNDEYSKPLGAPLANATLEGQVWTRKFKGNGQTTTNVTFDQSTGQGKIEWAPSLST
eukprot:m.29650 g.29650  ORF g.29650 m.29650 type:complete len:349 (-) comp14390_c1_seq2:772-1818(-)